MKIVGVLCIEVYGEIDVVLFNELFDFVEFGVGANGVKCYAFIFVFFVNVDVIGHVFFAVSAGVRPEE